MSCWAMFGVVRKLFDEDQDISQTFSCSANVRHVSLPHRIFQRTNEICQCTQVYIRSIPTESCLVFRRLLNLNEAKAG